MSERGRGGRGRAEHRAYDDYDDLYGAPRSRAGRPQPQYSERNYRVGKLEGPPLPQLQYQPYMTDGRDYAGPPGLIYGYQPGWAEGRPMRAPYSTGPQPYSAGPQPQPYSTGPQPYSTGPQPYSTGPQHRQYQDPYPVQPPNSQRSAAGSRWSGSGAGRPHSGRPPSSSGGGGGGANNGRMMGPPVAAGGNYGRPFGNGRPGSARPPSRGRTGGAPSGTGTSSGGGQQQQQQQQQQRRSRSNSRVGAGSGRPRAPYTTTAEPAGLALVPARPSSAAGGDEVAAAAEPEVPSNPHFLTPAFPQPPRTRTDSCNTWALMLEASCQTLEAVVGPLLEGVLMELFGESWEAEVSSLALPLPPFSAATCAELVTRCKQLHERLPITIHKRVEAVGKATSSLASSPGSLAPEDVVAAHTAMRGVLQDCVKALKMPSLLGAGSRQFRAFAADLAPHAESMTLYYDMLLADCAEAAAARQQARVAAAEGVEAGLLALPAPSPAEAPSP